MKIWFLATTTHLARTPCFAPSSASQRAYCESWDAWIRIISISHSSILCFVDLIAIYTFPRFNRALSIGSFDYRKSTRRHLLFWCLVGCNTILNVIILAAVSVRIYKHIGRSMRHSLEKGIQNYLTAARWKKTIDIWQYKLQCCGIDDYKDWYEFTWMDKYHVNVANRITDRLVKVSWYVLSKKCTFNLVILDYSTFTHSPWLLYEVIFYYSKDS